MQYFDLKASAGSMSEYRYIERSLLIVAEQEILTDRIDKQAFAEAVRCSFQYCMTKAWRNLKTKEVFPGPFFFTEPYVMSIFPLPTYG